MKKKKSSVSLGPGAPSLILIFVVLALSALSMLALMNARNDYHLSERSARVVEAVYALNCRAEERRAELDGILKEDAPLPEDMTLEEDVISWTESDGTRLLHCAVSVPDLEWVSHSLVSATEDEDVEWFD